MEKKRFLFTFLDNFRFRKPFFTFFYSLFPTLSIKIFIQNRKKEFFSITQGKMVCFKDETD